MSLTSLIKHNEDIKTFLLRTMPGRENFTSNIDFPAFSRKVPVRVPAGGGNAANVGMFSDFLIRYVLANYAGIPMDYHIAQRAITQPRYFPWKSDLAEVLQEKFNGFKEKLDAGIDAEALLFMVRMEQVAHGQALADQYVLDISTEGSLECGRMLQVFREVFIDSGLVTSNSDIVLSPSFGKWGSRIGGADADVYIDGTLYDFKSKQDTGYSQYDVMQLWGYYLLHRLETDGAERYLVEGEPDCAAELGGRKIDNLAIYYSRYGVIHSCPVPEVSDEELREFAWLIATSPRGI